MRILIALPGLHRYDRGAEIAFIAVAKELVKSGDAVTLIGSGNVRDGAPYRYLRAASMRREYFERFPSLPILRNETFARATCLLHTMAIGRLIPFNQAAANPNIVYSIVMV
jgi:hypothetical protein